MTDHPVPSLIEQMHRHAMTAPIGEIALFMQELLSRQLVARIAGVNGKSVTRWATGEITEIRDPTTEQRLRASYEIAQLLLGNDSPQTVRAWFIGLNPNLNDIPPVDAIADGKLKDVLAAARAFAASG